MPYLGASALEVGAVVMARMSHTDRNAHDCTPTGIIDVSI